MSSGVITIDNLDQDLDELYKVLSTQDFEEGHILNINVSTQEMFDKVKKWKLPYFRRVFLRSDPTTRLYGLPVKNTHQ